MIPKGIPTQETSSRFAIFTAVSKIHDTSELQSMVESYLTPLRALGGETWDICDERAGVPILIFVATGGTESQILQAAQSGTGGRLLLIAHPGHNSLPAALEVLARLHQQGMRGEIVYLTGPSDREGFERLAVAIHDRAVRQALQESRIGLVGAPSDWLVASSPAIETVRKVWGPTVVSIPLELILSEPDEEVLAKGRAIARDFSAHAQTLMEPAESDLVLAGCVYAMLCRVVKAERLDAVTVRCFDLVMRKQTSGCLALAQLNDDGIVAGCEGDMAATVAMLWLRHILGKTSWMANPSRIDLERGILSLAHCTVARSLVSQYCVRSHFESGLGVGIQGSMPPGPVTLVRIGGMQMEQLRALEGELLESTAHADLCRTQAEIEVGRGALEELLTHPLGNHMVMVSGHHATTLNRWHEAMIG